MTDSSLAEESAAGQIRCGHGCIHDGVLVAVEALEARPGHRLFKSDGENVEIGRAAAPGISGRLLA